MKQSHPVKTSFMVRNNSLNKQPTHRINSLEKQLNQIAQHKGKTDSCEAKEQSSAIMQLLQIKDQHVEWKDKNLAQKPTKSKNTKRSMNDIHNINDPSMLFDSQQRIKEDFREQQYLMHHSPFLDNIFTKKNSQQELNSKNSELKKSQQFTKYENHKMLRESNNNDNFLMNRTHYRNKLAHNSKSSHERNHDFSLTQRLNNRFLPKKTFYERQLDESLRANSNFEFYRNKSPLDKGEYSEQQNNKKMVESSLIQNKSIKIQANKSITVRQMLQKISSHQDISLAQPSIQQKKLRSLLQSNTNRQPFDPYTKKAPRQHYKKFTPFKIEQQRKLEYSLQKLEEHIKRNPEIDNKWDEIELRYLEKPHYCSWVERNKEKIKRKRNHPLTVRPLKLLN